MLELAQRLRTLYTDAVVLGAHFAPDSRVLQDEHAMHLVAAIDEDYRAHDRYRLTHAEYEGADTAAAGAGDEPSVRIDIV